MSRMRAAKLCVALLAAYLLSCDASSSIRIQQYTRQINLKQQYAIITETIKVKNSGSAPLGSVVVCRLQSLADREASFTAKQDKQELSVQVNDDGPDGVECLSVTLAKPVAAGDAGTVQTTGHYTHVFTAFPAEIIQGEDQLMLYVDNLYALSPYQVSSQNTEVELPSSKVQSYTQVKPATISGSTIKLGRYDSIQPFTFEELKVHFEHKKPFIEVVQLVQEITVSHWGNIYVEESYELKNGGAKHKGQFSRLRYSALVQANRGNHFRDLTAHLPAGAHSLYYRDLIGNISSSKVRSTMSETMVELEMRYPLMGGWKTDFVLGYSLPLRGFLFHTGATARQLKLDFGSPIEGVIVDDLVVKVVLPEGAADIKAALPFDIEQSFETKHTYLDTTGRPVLVLRKSNVVPDAHDAKLVVDYAFNPLSMLREPLLLVTAFAAIFIAVMVFQRWDFTISKDDAWLQNQNRDRLSSSMLAASRAVSGIVGAIKKLEELAASGGEDATQERHSIDSTIADLTVKVKQQLKEAEELSGKAAAEGREVLAKAAAAQAKAVAAVATRVDALKKGIGAQELFSRTKAAVKAAAEGRRELEAAASKAFGAY